MGRLKDDLDLPSLEASDQYVQKCTEARAKLCTRLQESKKLSGTKRRKFNYLLRTKRNCSVWLTLYTMRVERLDEYATEATLEIDLAKYKDRLPKKLPELRRDTLGSHEADLVRDKLIARMRKFYRRPKNSKLHSTVFEKFIEQCTDSSKVQELYQMATCDIHLALMSRDGRYKAIKKKRVINES